MNATQEFQERVGRIDKLVQKLEFSPDLSLSGTARELVQVLLELHGTGLERILEIVSSNGGDVGAAVIEALGRDELVSSLLVLYGLHPEDFETRVRRGLDKVRPLLRSRGAGLDIVTIEGDQVCLRITGAASHELQEAVREALFEAAPDAVDVAIEGAVNSTGKSSFVPLSSLRSCNAAPVLTTDSGHP